MIRKREEVKKINKRINKDKEWLKKRLENNSKGNKLSKEVIIILSS